MHERSRRRRLGKTGAEASPAAVVADNLRTLLKTVFSRQSIGTNILDSGGSGCQDRGGSEDDEGDGNGPSVFGGVQCP